MIVELKQRDKVEETNTDRQVYTYIGGRFTNTKFNSSALSINSFVKPDSENK